MTTRFDAEALIARMAEARPQAVALGEIVALAASVDRRLLRKARRELTGAGPEAEADLYFSELVLDRSPARFIFRPEAALALRRRLAARPAELQRAWALVSARHGTLPPTVRTEELLQWHALNGDTGAVRDLLRACVSTLVEQGRQGFAAWAIDAVARMDPLVRDHEEYRMLGLGAAMRTGARPQQIAELSDERLAEWLEWLAPDTGARTELGFTLVEGGIEFGPVGDKRYSETITLPGRFPQLLDIREAGGTSHALNLRATAPTFLETASNDLVITTEDGTRLRVRPPGQRFVNAERAPRVHISYDVETFGTRKSVELPFVIGVLGDFAGLAGERSPLAERRFRDIDATNFDQVMAQIGPLVRMSVPDEIGGGEPLSFELRFESMDDFTPDAIVRKVPQTADLITVRDALNDLMIAMDGKDSAQEMVTTILTDWRMILALADQVPLRFAGPLATARHDARKQFLQGNVQAALSMINFILLDRGARPEWGARLLQIESMMSAQDWIDARAHLDFDRTDRAQMPDDNAFLLAELSARTARCQLELKEFSQAEAHFRMALRHLDDAGLEAAELRSQLHNDLARIYNDEARIIRSAEAHRKAEAELKKAIDYQQRATSKVFFPHQLLPPAKRAPNRKSSVEALATQVITLVFGPRAEERKVRIWNALTGLSAILADEPQINFGEPFKTITCVIDWLDQQIGRMVNHILADPGFRQLESTWRGLEWLVGQTETGPDLKIRLFDLAESELLEATECDEPLSPGGIRGKLFREIYESEFSQFGGEPFTAILCDFGFGDSTLDLQVLRQMGAIGECARTTFIAPAAPEVLGIESWENIQDPRDIPADSLTLSGDNAATQAFRQSDASRHVALAMPPIFGRARYGKRSNPVERFAFDEDGPPLTISAIWPLGMCLTRAFRENGWLARISGAESGGTVSNLPLASFGGDTEPRVTQGQITDRRELALASAGLIPLVARKNSDSATFFSLPTLHNKAETRDARWVNSRRALPLELTHARFAHHLMCMHRDRIEKGLAPRDIEIQSTGWLLDYVSADDAGSDDARAVRPLRDASLLLGEDTKMPDYLLAELNISPAHQFDNFDYLISGSFPLPLEV